MPCTSLSRALAAQSEGRLTDEIAPVTITTRKGDTLVAEDEQPKNARPDKIPTLKPAFRADGTVTPANASSISDGAAALVLMRESDARAANAPIRARCCWPMPAMPRSQDGSPPPPSPRCARFWIPSAGRLQMWTCGKSTRHSPSCPWPPSANWASTRDRLNVNGGACALGHPIGASGTRIIVTLLHALEKAGKTKGIASLCIGGGEGTAVALEVVG